MKIALIILNWNGKKDTLECLDSIAKLEYKNFETILVDNGSTDDSVASFPPHITLLKNKENLGFAEGNNVGIRYALERISTRSSSSIMTPWSIPNFSLALQTPASRSKAP